MSVVCTGCGSRFVAPPRRGTGRPRTRCEACRGNIDRIDGVTWRQLRRQVLAEEPHCCVEGCPMPSTQVDHVIPLKVRPDLGLDRANLRGICARHNASKGARLPGEIPRPSPINAPPSAPRRWVL